MHSRRMPNEYEEYVSKREKFRTDFCFLTLTGNLDCHKNHKLLPLKLQWISAP